MDRLKQLQEFLLETPNDPFLNYALTMEYVKLGEVETAARYFEKMVSEYPDYVGTYYHYGKFLEKTDNKAKAEEIFMKGMGVAQVQRNRHALNELQGALNMLQGLDEDDEEY